MRKTKKLFGYLLLLIVLVTPTLITAQVIKITDNLTGEGIQKFPANMIVDLHEKFQKKFFSLLAFKQDGTALGFNEYYKPFFVTNEKQITGYDVYLPQPGDLLLQPIKEKSLLFYKDNNGDENHQLYLFDLENKQSIQLTTKTNVTDVNSYLWSADGTSIYFMDGNRKQNKATLCRINPETKEINRLADFSGDTRYLTDLNSTSIVFRTLVSANETNYSIFDIKTGKLSLLTKEKGFYRAATFSHNGLGVWLLSNNQSDFFKLYYFDLKTSKSTLVTDFSANITAYAISPDEKTLALKINEAGADTVHLYQLNRMKIVRELTRPPIKSGVLFRFVWRNNNELGFSLETLKTPLSVEIYNLNTKQITTLAKGSPNQELVDNLNDAKLIQWSSFDKKNITGYLLTPSQPAQKKLPVLIDIHGGPKQQYQPDFNVFKSYPASKLEAVVILPNLRGSSGFGKDFENSDNELKRLDAIKDLISLLDWIKTQPNLDSERVIVRGQSYGGLMALALAIKEPLRIKAVIAESPIISINNLLTFVSPSVRELQLAEYGSPENPQISEFNESISLLNSANLKNFKTPVFLAVGQNDNRIPVKDVELLKEKLKSQNCPVWFLKAENEGHIWDNYENRLILNVAEQFFMEKQGGF